MTCTLCGGPWQPDRRGANSLPPLAVLELTLSNQTFDLIAADVLADGEMTAARAGRWNVLIARIDGEYHAIIDRCSHAASRLSTGLVKQRSVMCPRHGARFDLTSGKCLGSAYPAVRSFPTYIQDGRVIVAVPDRAPDMSEVPLG